MNTRRSRFAGLVLLGLLEACGGGTPTISNPPPQSLRRFAYVANEIGGVFAYTIDDTGVVTLVNPTVVGNGNAEDVVVDHSAKFAYSADCFSHEVSTYAIDSASGALINAGPGVSAGLCPQHVVIHPTGKFLYVLAGGFAEGTEPTNPEQLTVFRIDTTTGALGLVSTVTVGTGNFIGRLAIEPTGRFAYACNGGAFLAFSIDQSSGVLTPIPGPTLSAGAAPFNPTADPSGTFLFVFVTDGVSNDLSTFSINPTTGALTEMARTTLETPREVAVDPKGKFIYVTNGVSNNVSAFLLNRATGTLTPVAGSPFPAGSLPLVPAIDPTAKFLLVSNTNSDDISVYTIDGITGVLRQVPGSPFSQGGSPARSPVGVAIVQIP
jgi:6-phosphogluconolactonase